LFVLAEKIQRFYHRKERTDLQQQQLAALIENDYDYTRPRRGEFHEAVILSITEKDVLVALGAKRDGIVPRKDLESLDAAYRASLQVGDRVPVVVLKESALNGELLVSLKKGQDWLHAQDLLESGQVVEAQVTGFNRGGVTLSFGRLRGFVPNSHLTSLPTGLRGKCLQQAKSELVGQTLSLVVIEADQQRRRLVLSERATGGRRRHQQLLAELIVGEVRTGIVRNLVDFGAFVDLGGVDGLIHISELDWKHVNHPTEVLRVGDEIEVYVLSVDRERERVTLSRKRLLSDPWHRVTATLDEGEVVEGTVTGVVPFGTFVEIDKGVEGLIHPSEMPGGQATHSGLKPGSLVTVRVLEIDEGERQITLSLQDAEVLQPRPAEQPSSD
jgi:small subunit ribosomal protein S1